MRKPSGSAASISLRCVLSWWRLSNAARAMNLSGVRTPARPTVAVDESPTPEKLPKWQSGSFASRHRPAVRARLAKSFRICLPRSEVQHHRAAMPRDFTRSLANRLNLLSPLTVREAEDEEPLLENRVYIAPVGITSLSRAHRATRSCGSTPRPRYGE